jgi:hypothetical protein
MVASPLMVHRIVAAHGYRNVFVLLMFGEPYLRRSIPRHQLLRHFATLALPLALAGLIGWGLLRIALAAAVGG